MEPVVMSSNGRHALASGFVDPVTGSQRIFRQLLVAMSEPGRIVSVEPDVLAGQPPFPRAMAGVALTLFDSDTPVSLHPDSCTGARRDWLAFHCGVRMMTGDGTPSFVILPAAALAEIDLEGLDLGTDEAPDRSSTLVVETSELVVAGNLALTGPGIPGHRTLGVAGVEVAFWKRRAALAGIFPRGLDLIFCAPNAVACLPRTTRVEFGRSGSCM